MILSLPASRNEIPSSHSSCGQCCVASTITDYTGRTVTDENIEAEYGSGETNAQTLVNILADNGIAARVRFDPLLTLVDSAIAERHRCFPIYQCDGMTNPRPTWSTDIAHWPVCYGNEGGVQLMNPWGGGYVTYSRDAMGSADRCATYGAVEVMVVMPQDQTQQGDDMPQQTPSAMVQYHQNADENRPIVGGFDTSKDDLIVTAVGGTVHVALESPAPDGHSLADKWLGADAGTAEWPVPRGMQGTLKILGFQTPSVWLGFTVSKQ